MLQINLDSVQQQAKFYQATNAPSPEVTWDRLAIIYRVLRSGRETTEVLPLWFAEMVVEAIPECEPETARARLVRLGA